MPGASGLILVVIVAIWAAYFIQHWVRRREHLATSRSVDRFTEAMRVLERRVPLPQTPLTGETRSQSFGLVRPARPEVVVKRAVPRPFVDLDEDIDVDRDEDALVLAQRVEAESAEHDDAPGQVRVGSLLFRWAARVNARRVRGLLLLASLVTLVVLVVTSALVRTYWWSITIPAAVLAVVLVASVLAGARARSLARLRARERVRTTVRPAAHTYVSTAQPQFEDDLGLDGELVELGDLGAPGELVERAGGPMSPAATLSPAPGSWAPRAVPPPTYTLKARAAQARPEPAATAPRPQYASMSVRDLPFDGLALDEELEDLPAAYRVG